MLNDVDVGELLGLGSESGESDSSEGAQIDAGAGDGGLSSEGAQLGDGAGVKGFSSGGVQLDAVQEKVDFHQEEQSWLLGQE